MKNIEVSVIVTTRNEEKHISECLSSIKAQKYPREQVEITVVDNDSTDRTREIAARFTERVYKHGPERSAQRNFGISRSRGKYFLYLDADMILREDVIGECVRRCEENNYVGLYIPEKIVGEGFWIKVRNFERSFYTGTCIDAMRFVLKKTAVEIGGFDENLNGPEDWDFDRRLRQKGRVAIVSSALYHQEGKFNFSNYLNKKAYYTRSFDSYRKKWGRNDTVIKKQLGFFYRFIGVFCEGGKWKRLVSHPVLTAAMYFLRFRVGLAYLKSANQYSVNHEDTKFTKNY